ncbi:sugar ABC transporter permease [Streptomyces samsunensis]|uniref:Sugar ABC transporter permease n=3 Tax=Streptomyces TaxID=1883 RepID=A0A9X2M776_STRMQ|nr:MULTISPECIES: sugar ABC transporter permease [Streptomyces]WPB93046.1 sugar ABC transporter permease [Streptomyces malaysiensis]MCQ8836318.1 sugar ABC transporter permease [Streptomyces samsunensis]NUH35215.1 sugar ABC transporter permease [Streptomyces samsunensis]UHH18093.1 sugar ABC transporter permease [Streptomyces sp. HNM0561]WHX20781.1 sugar ABC transporter permease [Streptomyces sp. NA07423]
MTATSGFTPDTAAPPAGQGGAAPRAATAQAPDPAEQRRRDRRSRRYRWDVRWSPYAFVAPFFIFFAAFGLFPLLYTGWASLHQVELTDPTHMEWAGWHNFSRLWEDEFFWKALRNTFTIGVISTVPQLMMALGIAHLLNYRLRASMFFRVAILTPYATSVAAATLVFALLFGRDYGMVNWSLGLVGLDGIDWQNGTWTSQIAVSTIVIWRWTGYNALIYLAAMQAVPNDLYESAALDGASRWKQFLHVTVPSLRPTILFTVVVSTIGATQLFGEPLLFNTAGTATGGADHQYQTLGLYMYEQGWVNLHLGRASAIAWTMFLILLLIAAANALFARRLRKSQ